MTGASLHTHTAAHHPQHRTAPHRTPRAGRDRRARHHLPPRDRRQDDGTARPTPAPAAAPSPFPSLHRLSPVYSLGFRIAERRRHASPSATPGGVESGTPVGARAEILACTRIHPGRAPQEVLPADVKVGGHVEGLGWVGVVGPGCYQADTILEENM